jgi:hypothetical protein
VITIPSSEEMAEVARRRTTEDFIELEQAAGQPLGPFHRQWLLERRAPAEVRRLIERARLQPEIVGMPEQLFNAAALVPPFSHTAVANTVTETYLWIPGQFASIPVGDPFAGKSYFVKFGGIVSTTGTPTVINTLRWHGATSTTVGGVSLGASIAGTTATGLANAALYGEAVVTVRSLGLAATSATVVAAGNTTIAGAAGTAPSFTIGYGTNGTATVDTYTQANLGIGVGWTWSAASASNTVTCQYVVFGSFN